MDLQIVILREERQRKKLYHSYAESNFLNDTNEHIYKREIDSHILKINYSYQRGNMGIGPNEESGINIYHTTIYKRENQQGPTYSTGHSTQYSV